MNIDQLYLGVILLPVHSGCVFIGNDPGQNPCFVQKGIPVLI